MLVQHWLPYMILVGMIAAISIPNMLRKDRSLARYPEFESYQANSGLLFPKLWGRDRQAVEKSAG